MYLVKLKKKKKNSEPGPLKDTEITKCYLKQFLNIKYLQNFPQTELYKSPISVMKQRKPQPVRE